MSAPPDIEQTPPEHPDSPGKRLRVARQAKGLTRDKVATQLHLSQPMVLALENDDFDRLPGPVFVRGYLRNFARLVDTDESAVLRAYEARQPPVPEVTPRVRPTVQHEIRSSHVGVRLVSWIIVIGLLALLGIWWQGNLSWNGDSLGQDTGPLPTEGLPENGSLVLPEPVSEAPEEAAPGEMPARTDTSEAPAAEIQEQPPQPPEQTDSGAPLVEAPIPAPQEIPQQAGSDQTEAALQPTAPVPVPQPAVTPANGVVVEFLGSCWVDIRDSTRTFKLLGEIKAGETRTLGGTPPYNIILGNSAAVRVTVDGEPFNVAAHSKGNVARFALDPNAPR